MDKNKRRELKKIYKETHKDPEIEKIKQAMLGAENNIRNGLSEKEMKDLINKNFKNLF